MNLEDVELLSHDLESVFGPVLEGERELSPAIFAVAYRTLDAIGELICRGGAGASRRRSTSRRWSPRCTRRPTDPVPAHDPATARADLGGGGAR